VRSRRAHLNYGDFSQVLQYLIAYDDVLIKETGIKKIEKNPKPEVLRYATSGQADFDTHRDIILLTQFPQVYQGEDTATGDIILMHRDTDVIEIEHSNSFSQGHGE
jgi:lipopolysaccharide export system protein LptA